MKKCSPVFFVLLLLLTTAFFACKKSTGDDDGSTPPPQPPSDTTRNFATKEVQVALPTGSTIDLASCTLMTFSTTATVDKNGRSKVAYNAGSPLIAYLFDKENRLLLAGFITDSTATINAASTAKVLLYYAYGLSFQPYELTPLFINKAEQVPGITQWITEFSGTLAAKPLALSDGSFGAPLRAKMEALTKGGEVLNIRAGIEGRKAADISVDAADIRSGLQVSSDDLSQIAVTNSYRRRAHAFLYKKAFKDKSDHYTELLPSLESTTNPAKDFKVDPVAGITGFLGEVGKNIEGKGLESFAVKTDPVELTLEDNESEATYLLRIVGPGGPGTKTPVTNKEILKQTRLEIETIALDFLLPLLMDVSGNKEALGKQGFNVGNSHISTFVDKAELFIKAFPDVYEEMKQGNYKMAARKGVSALWSNAGQKFLGELIFAAVAIQYDMAKIQNKPIPSVDMKKVDDAAQKFMGAMKVVDMALQGTDYIRLAGNILSSAQLEEWTVKAKESQVRLTPEENTLVAPKTIKLKAIVKNLADNPDTHPYFEWRTSGKWGTLSDTKGHKNLTSFESSDAEISYYSKATAAQLTDENNIDYVYVTAYMGNKKIGTDTAVVNIQKAKYQLRPDGATISGKEGAPNKLMLHLETANGDYEIKPDGKMDFKIIWTISGKYGKLFGRVYDNQTTATVYNFNDIGYECLDKDTKEGVENVTARIYSKQKSDPVDAYVFFDEVKGTIKINNDDKKIILHIPTTLLHGDTVSGPHRSWPSGSTYYSYVCMKTTAAIIPVVKDAKSYSLKFYGQKKPTIGAYTNHSWTPENLRGLSGPSSYVRPKFDGSTYCAIYSYSSYNGATDKHVETGGNPGMAEVIVTLK